MISEGDFPSYDPAIICQVIESNGSKCKLNQFAFILYI